jgi:hypothetical protein
MLTTVIAMRRAAGVRMRTIVAVSVAGAVAVAVGVAGILAFTSRGEPEGSPSPDPMQTGGLPGWASIWPLTEAGPLLSSPPRTGKPTSVPWQFVSLGDDGTKLEVFYVKGDGGCTMPAGFQVQETTTTVELWAWSTTDESQEACAAMLAVGREIVTLPAPLGSRTLLHAPTDPQWSSPNMLGP